MEDLKPGQVINIKVIVKEVSYRTDGVSYTVRPVHSTSVLDCIKITNVDLVGSYSESKEDCGCKS